MDKKLRNALIGYNGVFLFMLPRLSMKFIYKIIEHAALSQYNAVTDKESVRFSLLINGIFGSIYFAQKIMFSDALNIIKTQKML